MSDAEVGKRVTEILNRIFGSKREQFKTERAELKKLLAENQGGAATKAWAHHAFEYNRKKHGVERVFDEATQIVEGRCDDAPSDDLLEFANWIIRWLGPTMPVGRQRRPRKLPSNVIPFRRPVKKIAGAQSGDGPKAAS